MDGNQQDDVHVDDLLDREDDADLQPNDDDAPQQGRSNEAGSQEDGGDPEDDDATEQEVNAVRQEAGVQDVNVDWLFYPD